MKGKEKNNEERNEGNVHTQPKLIGNPREEKKIGREERRENKGRGGQERERIERKAKKTDGKSRGTNRREGSP